MAKKVRVYELAKEINMEVKELIGVLKETGLDVKSMSTVSNEVAQSVRKLFPATEPVETKTESPVEKPVVEENIKQNIQPTQNLTPEEQAIASRVAAEDDSWKTITEEELGDFSLMDLPYQLPDEAKKLQDAKKFAFRWIERKATRIDEVRNWPIPKRWWLVNRNQPDAALAKYCDANHGAVQCEDHVLVSKEWWMHQKMKKANRDILENLESAAVENMDGMTKQDGKVTIHAGRDVAGKGRHNIGKNDIVEYGGESMSGGIE